jgi:lipoyl(octanoyl) transferase
VNDVAAEAICLKPLGLVPYGDSLAAMRAFTAGRGPETPDELWLLQHPPVYTRGLAADAAFGPRIANGIPVVQVERGGEVTYHGPGQAVVYTLVDLGRRGIKVREFVALLEQAVIDLLAASGVRAERKCGAPGAYVDGAKLAALGIRVTRGRAFHGLAMNVDLDLAPFAAIDPCGYPGLAVTRTCDHGVPGTADELGERLCRLILERLEHA